MVALGPRAVDIALGYEGDGGLASAGNNRGPFIELIGAPQGASWCAHFVSFAYEEAAHSFGVEWTLRTGGARKLFRRMGKHGQFLGKDPSVVLPGDVALWDRSKPLDPKTWWWRHIGLVVQWDGDLVHTIEGNIGKADKVRQLSHDVEKEPKFLGFARYDRPPSAAPSPCTGLV